MNLDEYLDIEPNAETIAFYESLSTRELMTVGAAFQLDSQRDLPPPSRQFCDNRLALIARILANRDSPTQH